jgi:hypothetical protein
LKFRALSVEDFLGYEASLVSVLCIRIDKIWKEKELEYQEDDGKLDKDDGPERLAQGHLPETIVIEMENPGQQSLFHRFYIRFHQVFILFLLHKHSFLKKSAANLQ